MKIRIFVNNTVHVSFHFILNFIQKCRPSHILKDRYRKGEKKITDAVYSMAHERCNIMEMTCESTMCITKKYGVHRIHVHRGVMYMLKRAGTLLEPHNSVAQRYASSMPLVTLECVLQTAKIHEAAKQMH